MSGGSYNYLYMSAPEEIASIRSNLESMREHTRKGWGLKPDPQYKEPHPFAKGVTVEEETVLEDVRMFLAYQTVKLQQVEADLRKASEVLRAIEWWASGDTGHTQVVEAFKGMK